MLACVGKPFALPTVGTSDTDKHACPAEALAQSSAWADALFALLEQPPVAAAAWGILQAAPTCAGVEALCVDPSQTDWATALHADRPLWRKIYLCQVWPREGRELQSAEDEKGGGLGSLKSIDRKCHQRACRAWVCARAWFISFALWHLPYQGNRGEDPPRM